MNDVFSFQLAMTGRVTKDRYSMPKLVLVTFLLTGSLCSALSAAAQTDGSQETKLWFAARDRNRDGYITAAEVIGYETKLFNRMDNEKNGRLRQDQYCAGIPTYNRAEQNRCHNRFVKSMPIATLTSPWKKSRISIGWPCRLPMEGEMATSLWTSG